MIQIRRNAALGAALWLSACAGVPEDGAPAVTKLTEPEPIRTESVAALVADPEACFGEDQSPAVIETVTEQIQVAPPSVSVDGSELFPAVYETETRQKIVEERRVQMFEALCEAELTPQLVASLQRALKVRGQYRGPVTGRMTPSTQTAIRAYQKPQGLDSAVLSLAAARQLGLIEVKRLEVD